jgi:hypothetical protein
MRWSSADAPAGRDGGEPSAVDKENPRKDAERRRLAAALRANLARRKAQSRARRTAGEREAEGPAVDSCGEDPAD